MTVEHLGADPRFPAMQPSRTLITGDDLEPANLKQVLVTELFGRYKIAENASVAAILKIDFTKPIADVLKNPEIEGFTPGRYSTFNEVRMWFEFERGRTPPHRGETWENGPGGEVGPDQYAISTKPRDRQQVYQFVNVPRARTAVRLAEWMMGWERGSIREVLSITVMGR